MLSRHPQIDMSEATVLIFPMPAPSSLFLSQLFANNCCQVKGSIFLTLNIQFLRKFY